MTTYDWPTIRADAIRRFNGDAPRAELEQRIIDIFEQQPQLVVHGVDQIADSFHAGKVRSPWAVLITHLERSATPGAQITAVDTTDKQRAIQRAEQWIRAAGIHYDRQTEILLELFDSTGLLHAYAQIEQQQVGINEGGHPIWALSEPKGDTALVDRMVKVYTDARPAGIAAEDEAAARAEKWKTDQARIAALKAQVLAELDAKQTVPPEDPPADLFDQPTDDIPF